MTRGRQPLRAQEVADPIALKRGIVQHYQYEPGAIFSFTIFGKICDAHVRMKCVRRLGCTMQELERDLADVLVAIRLTASGPGIFRELWLCSPRYALRFFRVPDAGLVELDKEGVPLGTEALSVGSAVRENTGNAAAITGSKPAGTGTLPTGKPEMMTAGNAGTLQPGKPADTPSS